MDISKIELSIEGYGRRQGMPSVHVHRHGCDPQNANCSGADCGGAFDPMTVDELMYRIGDVGCGCRAVAFTGCDPLQCRSDSEFDELHRFFSLLHSNGYDVDVMTKGSVDLFPFKNRPYSGNVWFTVDWPSDSNGMADAVRKGNLDILGENDVLRFVIETQVDLDRMYVTAAGRDLPCTVYASPSGNGMDARRIVDYIVKSHLNGVCVQTGIDGILDGGSDSDKAV